MSFRGWSRAAATSKMECFVIIVNGFQPLTFMTKHSILDVAAALDPPLCLIKKQMKWHKIQANLLILRLHYFVSVFKNLQSSKHLFHTSFDPIGTNLKLCCDWLCRQDFSFKLNGILEFLEFIFKKQCFFLKENQVIY